MLSTAALVLAMPFVLVPLDALSPRLVLQLDDAEVADLEPREMEGEATVPATRDGEPEADEIEPEAPADRRPSELGAQLRERQRLRPWHVGFGIATNIASSTTVVLGYLQYHDRFGFGAAQNDTPCARGAPILGTDLCAGIAWPHAIAAAALTTLASATFIIAAFMPDPLDAASGRGAFPALLSAHRALRWVVAGLILAQAIFGGIIANIDTDYGTAQALAGAHLATGTVTGAAMLTQAILGSIMAEL